MPEFDNPDDFLVQADDEKPATRGELRSLRRSIRGDLKWVALATVVSNQTLSHLQVPTAAGFVGSAAVFGLVLVKLAVTR